MMGWIGPERRVHPRVAFVAEAKLFIGDRAFGSYAVQDISIGGALVVGDLAPPLGQRVGVALTASQFGTVRLDAVVVRVHSSGRRQGVGIAFVTPPSPIARMIEEVVLNELARLHGESVLDGSNRS